ncbi:MAG: adenylate kinase, partial [Armatimonadota bacterium]
GGELKVRSDTSEEVVRERLEQFRRKTLPLVGFYEGRGLLERVDAAPSPEEVERQTERVLRDLMDRE